MPAGSGCAARPGLAQWQTHCPSTQLPSFQRSATPNQSRLVVQRSWASGLCTVYHSRRRRRVFSCPAGALSSLFSSFKFPNIDRCRCAAGADGSWAHARQRTEPPPPLSWGSLLGSLSTHGTQGLGEGAAPFRCRMQRPGEGMAWSAGPAAPTVGAAPACCVRAGVAMRRVGSCPVILCSCPGWAASTPGHVFAGHDRLLLHSAFCTPYLCNPMSAHLRRCS